MILSLHCVILRVLFCSTATHSKPQPRKPTQVDAREPTHKQPAVVHSGVGCDLCGKSPIVGPRYHKRGYNYDICQEDYEKLKGDGAQHYDRYDEVVTLHDWDDAQVVVNDLNSHNGTPSSWCSMLRFYCRDSYSDCWDQWCCSSFHS